MTESKKSAAVTQGRRKNLCPGPCLDSRVATVPFFAWSMLRCSRSVAKPWNKDGGGSCAFPGQGLPRVSHGYLTFDPPQLCLRRTAAFLGTEVEWLRRGKPVRKCTKFCAQTGNSRMAAGRRNESRRLDRCFGCLSSVGFSENFEAGRASQGLHCAACRGGRCCSQQRPLEFVFGLVVEPHQCRVVSCNLPVFAYAPLVRTVTVPGTKVEPLGILPKNVQRIVIRRCA